MCLFLHNNIFKIKYLWPALAYCPKAFHSAMFFFYMLLLCHGHGGQTGLLPHTSVRWDAGCRNMLIDRPDLLGVLPLQRWWWQCFRQISDSGSVQNQDEAAKGSILEEYVRIFIRIKSESAVVCEMFVHISHIKKVVSKGERR